MSKFAELEDCFCTQITKPVIPAGRFSDEVRRTSAETSELPRAAMSPWDAAVRFGYVEPAFEHLRQPVSTTSIPRPPTSQQHRPNKLSTAVTYMSPTRDLMTSPLDGKTVFLARSPLM